MLSVENSGKTLGGRGCPEPRGGSSQRSPDLIAGGEGVAAPKNPTPALGLLPWPQ